MSAARDDAKLRPETPTTYYGETVRLPGYGDAPDRCRDYSPVGFCDHGHVLLGRSSCGTRYCPDHWRDWCEGAVISIVARLAAYRQAQPEGWEKRMCHVVASPPQDRRYSEREMYDTRSDAYDALEEAGVRGGAVVTHPYRTTENADFLYERADTDHGKWRFLRDLAADFPGDDWESLESFIEAAPHYHALAAVEDVRGEDAPDGWVVENVRSFQRFDYEETESYEDMVRTAYYVLTHGAVRRDRSTTTYFGEVHPAVFNPEKELNAAVWGRIQREAERAVKGVEVAEEESEGAGGGPEECPREECEAVVRDVSELPGRLASEEWCSDVRATQGGRKRLSQLRGCLAWYEDRTDRPPPHARQTKQGILDWLRERGEVFEPDPSQVSLGTVMG
jgi:hypothetical protein